MSTKTKQLPAPEDFFANINNQLGDIQGLLSRGYKHLPYAEFLLLEINTDADGKPDDSASKYFFKVVNNFVTNSRTSHRADASAPLSENHREELDATNNNENGDAIEDEGDCEGDDIRDDDHDDDDDDHDENSDNDFDMCKAVQIAFTSNGLRKLGLPEEILQTFSREFLEGMSYAYTDPDSPQTTIRERSFLLGDPGSQRWKWGHQQQYQAEQKHFSVDCILLLYAQTEHGLVDLHQRCYTELQKGVTLIDTLPTYPLDIENGVREHFGFRDGISQPKMRGFGKTKDYNEKGMVEIKLTENKEEGDQFHNNKHEGNLVNPGEFILGYLNEYGSYSPSPFFDAAGEDNDIDPLPGHPLKRDLGKNGSYLVFRQMEQHVERFYRYVHKNSKESGKDKFEKAITLAAKMIGRWPNGQSLAENQNYLGEEKKYLDNFLYYKNDHYGIGCPFGAHVRRTNPRDQVQAERDPSTSLELSNKHRMLRRGRTYGAPLAASGKAEDILAVTLAKNLNAAGEPDNVKNPEIPKRGIHFLCLVSDIARQFEFVQNVWVNSTAFAELGTETDPITYPRSAVKGDQHHDFSTPQEIVRNRYKALPEFTTVIGGAYFFMPGIKALRFILSAKHQFSYTPA